jgi:hypothetical protein
MTAFETTLQLPMPLGDRAITGFLDELLGIMALGLEVDTTHRVGDQMWPAKTIANCLSEGFTFRRQ